MNRFLLLLALLLPAAAAAGPDVVVVETDHYRLEAEAPRPEVEEWGRVLEAAWPEFREFFGAEPELAEGERLRVVYCGTHASFNARLTADGITPPKAGGYYHPGNRTAYLWRQPTRLYTRTLLLHEVTHQFHYLARTRNRTLPQKWYVEGLAEHLGRHEWDGEGIRLGVLPMQSLEDIAAKALDTFQSGDKHLEQVVKGKVFDRPAAWATVRYLLTAHRGKHADKFRKVMEKLDRGSATGALLFRSFGSAKKLQPSIVAWLRTEQEPLKQLFHHWEGIGDGRMEGRAGPNIVSTCRVKGAARRIEATLVAPASSNWLAGLLLHHTDNDNYTVALLESGRKVRVDRRVGGAWKRLLYADCPKPKEPGVFRLEAERKGDRVSLLVEGKTVGTFELSGDVLGIAIQGGRARFRGLSWE